MSNAEFTIIPIKKGRFFTPWPDDRGSEETVLMTMDQIAAGLARRERLGLEPTATVAEVLAKERQLAGN